MAAQRDLVVVKAIVEKLSGKTADADDRIALVRLADALEWRPDISTKPDESRQQATALICATIERLRKETETKSKWPLASVRLAKSFRATEKAGEKALRGKKPAQFHDWRKKAKRLLYQLHFTEAVPGKQMTRTIKRVDKLQEKLGEYQDSVIAQDRLEQIPCDQLPPRVVRHSVTHLEERRRCLRKQVRSIFRHIGSR